MGLLDRFFPQADVEERAVYNSGGDLVDGSIALESLLATNVVTEQKLLKIPTAKACVDLITGSVAQMPVYLYKEAKDGTIERVDDYRVALINDEANDFLSGFNLKRNMTKDLLLHGAAYVSKIEAGNKVLELHPIPANSVTVNKRVQNGFRTVGADILVSTAEAGAINHVSQKQIKFKPYELLIALSETHDGLTGKGVIAHGQNIFTQAWHEMEYTSNLYERGALPLGLLKTEARLTENQTSALRSAWARLYGGTKNAAKTVVLQEGMEYEALSMKPNELQMTDSKKATNTEICKLFNVPESMVSSTVGKQYVSLEQNNLHFLKNTLSTILASLEAALNKSLLLESEKGQGYFFRFDTSELIRSTEKERVETLAAGINAKIYTVNEARAKLDLPELDEEELAEQPKGEMVNEQTTESEPEPGSQAVGTEDD